MKEKPSLIEPEKTVEAMKDPGSNPNSNPEEKEKQSSDDSDEQCISSDTSSQQSSRKSADKGNLEKKNAKIICGMEEVIDCVSQRVKKTQIPTFAGGARCSIRENSMSTNNRGNTPTSPRVQKLFTPPSMVSNQLFSFTVKN